MSSHEFFIIFLVPTLLDKNGAVECKNCHLVCKVPQHFLGDAILAACYLNNRMSSSILHNWISFHHFHSRHLFYFSPGVFGSVFFIFFLLDKTNFGLEHEGYDFRGLIDAILLKQIITSPLLMSLL